MKASDHAQVEFHKLCARDATGMALVAQNRAIFESLWSSNCAPAAPASV